jgi:hypothetical protein
LRRCVRCPSQSESRSARCWPARRWRFRRRQVMHQVQPRVPAHTPATAFPRPGARPRC